MSKAKLRKAHETKKRKQREKGRKLRTFSVKEPGLYIMTYK
jgi:hypothetical protein